MLVSYKTVNSGNNCLIHIFVIFIKLFCFQSIKRDLNGLKAYKVRLLQLEIYGSSIWKYEI